MWSLVWIVNAEHLGAEISIFRPCIYSSVVLNNFLALASSCATSLISSAKAREEMLHLLVILYP
jgi:hypothetical protein